MLVVLMAQAKTVSEVYELLAPQVLGYFRGRGARDPEALTGGVFVSVTTGLGTFRGDEAALRRWVFTIAHHRLVDEYRRSGRRNEFVVAEVPESAVADDQPIDAAMLEALSSLTDEQREVVVLRFVADLPIRDVAKIVGKRAGAVKMLQARGLAGLFEHLTGTADHA
jgi:RNA polymerase sigma-70 factor (ECF subfamily)